MCRPGIPVPSYLDISRDSSLSNGCNISDAMKALLFAVLAAVALQQCSGHIRLTWPPARFPDYDFLDNVRTGGPCGIPGKTTGLSRGLVLRNIFVQKLCRPIDRPNGSVIIAHILSPAAVEDAPVTTLIAGSTVDVSYHLAYPHRVNLYVLLKHHT